MDDEPVYRVVVAEDSFLIREGLRSALEQDSDEVEVAEYCPDLGRSYEPSTSTGPTS
jgi:Response regulator containing a CheY-like receiver domain and an HTH DNA-binding domain